MAKYVIGDLQGCFNEFISLLKTVDFNPSRDHLYLVGDIVARGPDSLACLKYLFAQQGSVTITLGNHDLHLLATYFTQKTSNPKDNLQALFNAKKLPTYIEFLRQQPLAVWLEKYNTFISHAGLNPQLSLQKAIELCAKAQKKYQGDNAQFYLANMYGNSVNCISQANDKLSRFTYTVNAFSRMRFVNQHGQMDFANKGPASQNSPELFPWFDVNTNNHSDINICFGHWAALKGQTPYPNLFALDTGCVWGEHMTLLELKSKKKHYCNNYKEHKNST
ncbi:symmetrical bis(5'-nucleosyl)-tetraphosphatase [Pseudoalteromonas spongiae]|uniref:symmetrical bis(5'-nucleosyl)-tetraphosphatase n=1 Tax=Pseudoalteromonas spongiae TaxID=298657 RepID=UPI00026CB826|nr:symmetrical bis(5'-nucleosyl)-tetraphosphatase [Pseudoalteromonas spongiae]ATC97847.1 bis(5'-nucleosyl)-tetraphosphatase (symmetrical) [Pseudoalteromonas spongiae UST010723-006]